MTSCQECGGSVVAHSLDLRIELTCDDEPVFYCVECRRVLSDLADLRSVSEQARHVHRVQVEAFNRQVDRFTTQGDRIEEKLAELHRRLGISDRPELTLVKAGDDA